MAGEGSSVGNCDLPSREWKLNVVLDEISQEMTEEDVNRAKYFCSGEEGISIEVLNTITSGRDLFQLLKRRNYLDRNNLLYLQAILWNLGKKRRALYQKLSEFAKRCELEPLNFFAQEEESMPGSSYVHFHVAGKDISRRNINSLRALVSELVMVPLHQVYINGVKPYRSILITFRLPVDVVGALRTLTPEEKGLLQNENIDSLFIETEEIRIANEISDIPARLSEGDEVIKLMNRNRKLEKEVERHLLEINEKERKVKDLNEDLQQMNKTFRRVLTILMDRRQDGVSIDFDKETILTKKTAEFFGKYPRCAVEMEALLKVKSEVVKDAERSKWSHYINEMVTECELQYRQLHEDVYELYSRCDISHDYSTKTHQLLEPSTPEQPSVSHASRQHEVRKSTASSVSGQEAVLREISMGLDNEQRNAFKGSMVFSDEEENILKESPQEFLGLVMKKEPLPKEKDLKQYLIDKLQASGCSDVEHVIRCFDATTSTKHEENAERLELVDPMAIPKANYTTEDLYTRLQAFGDVVPVLLNKLRAATDSTTSRPLRTLSTLERLAHGNV